MEKEDYIALAEEIVSRDFLPQPHPMEDVMFLSWYLESIGMREIAKQVYLKLATENRVLYQGNVQENSLV